MQAPGVSRSGEPICYAAPMLPVTRRTTLDIPADELMSILTNVERWPQTMPFVTAIDYLTPRGRACPGTRFTMTRKRSGAVTISELEVTAVESDTFKYVSRRPTDYSVMKWVVRPVHENPARCDVAFTGRLVPRGLFMKVLILFLYPFISIMGGDELRALKRVLRGEPADPPPQEPAPGSIFDTEEPDIPRAPDPKRPRGLANAIYIRVYKCWEFQEELPMFASCADRPVVLRHLRKSGTASPLPPASTHPATWANVTFNDSPPGVMEPHQRAAYEQLIREQSQIEQAALEAILKDYHEQRPRSVSDPTDSSWEDIMPEITGIDELRYLIAFQGITIYAPDPSGVCEIGLAFGCSWEQEHGLGVRLKWGGDTRQVLAVGDHDAA
jgi:hypothetical protein